MQANVVFLLNRERKRVVTRFREDVELMLKVNKAPFSLAINKRKEF